MPFKDTEKGKTYQRNYLKEYGIRNRAKLNLRSSLWRKDNLDKSRRIARESKLKIKYGITLEQYEAIYKEQNGCCAGCGLHQSIVKRTLHLDHCHSTGKIRGLLCDNCNLALGLLRDNPFILINLSVYLKKHGRNFNS